MADEIHLWVENARTACGDEHPYLSTVYAGEVTCPGCRENIPEGWDPHHTAPKPPRKKGTRETA